MDHAAWLQEGLEGTDEAREKYRYFMRTDPAMRDVLGPIEEVDDPITGYKMRRRLGKVAMTRNPAPESLLERWIWLDPLPHIRQEQSKDLQGWYQGKHNDRPGSRVRPCMTDAILTEPYGGFCTVGCSFCYINSGFRGYRGSGLVTVPLNYGNVIAKQLKKMRTSAAGYFSSFTDPFLPLESYYHNTQNAAQAFVDEGLPIFFLSRLSYPDWAYDMLRKNKYSYAQKSINTCDPDDWKRLSPGALPLEDHIDEIRALHEAGIYVSIQCNPIIAGVTTHEDIERLFEMLAEAGTDHVIVKFVEANHPWAGAMVDRITKRFGDNRAAAFKELFIENSCGGQRTVQEEYRREGHERYQRRATTLGMTYSLCYEYTKRPDGVWKSMGSEFLTSEQCHGHKVPMYTRLTPVSPFTEVAHCPPSGCLTCADSNSGKPRCGSELFGAAKALRMPDLKQPVYGV